jgi:hypothetical protein
MRLQKDSWAPRPIQPSEDSYKGSSYNVLVEWEDGSITSEPLKMVGANDPVSVA